MYNFITRSFVVDLFICLVAYLLKPVNESFTWIYIGSLIVLFWLGVAGTCSIFEFLVLNDER